MTLAPLPTLTDLARTFAKVGLLGFGGPAGQIALMHRIVVDEKRWLGEARYLHALNYCMLLPGPEAQQLATYIGWLMHGARGGVISGLLFILPGALVMLALSALYAVWAHVPLVQGLFYGVKCAVLIIVVQAMLRLSRRALSTRPLYGIGLASFLALLLFAAPFPLVILLAGLAGIAFERFRPGSMSPAAHRSGGAAPPGLIDSQIEAGALPHIRPNARRFWRTLIAGVALWLAPVLLLALALPQSLFADLARFFATMAVVTFGGAYAVLSYVAQEAVQTYAWVTPQQMIDGLGLAETTPGPLILVLQFVGFLAAFRAETGFDPFLAGAAGAVVTLWVTFVPSFVFIFAGAPYAEALRRRRTPAAALAGISAAVVGVITNLALWFGVHVFFRETGTITTGPLHITVPITESIDWIAVALTAALAVLALRLRLGVVGLVAVAGVAGMALSALPL